MGKTTRILEAIMSALFSTIPTAPARALWADSPPLRDLAELHLEVTKVEVVKSVAESSTLNQITLSARTGFQLVVATLEGQVPYDCIVSLETREFAAVTEEVSTNEQGDNEINMDIHLSSAIGHGADWSIPPGGSRMTLVYNLSKGNRVALKVAFILPDTVGKFFVRYPTLANREAIIPAPASSNVP
jgi:hypothetical protein